MTEVNKQKDEGKLAIKNDRLKIILDFYKFVLGTFILGLTASIINLQIQNRELEIKELERLGTFIEYALEENIATRRRFSQYFATATRSNRIRKRWIEYDNLVEKEYISKEKEKQEKTALLKTLEKEHIEGKKVDNLELAQLQQHILSLETELTVARQESLGLKDINILIDYAKLEGYLASEDYRQADAETRRIMYRFSGLGNGYLGKSSIEQIPCKHIRKIDQLWMNYSADKFGFSMQKRIWEEEGNSIYFIDIIDNFGKRVGWYKNGKWLTTADLEYSLQAPPGHLPSRSPGSPEHGNLSEGWLVFWLLPGNSDASYCLN